MEDKFGYPSHDSSIESTISFSNNLFLRGDLENKKIKIDDSFYILNNKSRNTSVEYLKKYIESKTGFNNIRGTYFLYLFQDSKIKKYGEDADCVRKFLTAVRIYKNTHCDSKINFSVKNNRKKEYYQPFFFINLLSDLIYDEKPTTISSRKELNAIKKIYKNIDRVKIDDHFSYSKLHNAIKFFNYAYDEKWTLLKTTLFYIALESLFSDEVHSEITYKTSLRVSYLLYPKEKDTIKRKEVFNFIKRGYDIRSHFVHGSESNIRADKLMKKIETEKGTDYYGFSHHFIDDLQTIVSNCLKIILMDESSFIFFSKEKYGQNEINNFFNNLVM